MSGGFHVCGERDDPNRELQLRVADLGRSKPFRWAWSRRIVIGQLNLLLGNEGIGKGALIAWLIARLTLGELEGDLKGTPINVGIVGDEDDLDLAWTPRLHAAGAELERVCQIERPNGGLVNVGEDRARLARLVGDAGIEVLYFDQLLDNLGAGVDDWRQKAVRDAIAPLRALSRELEIASLGTLHPNKRGRTFRELCSGTPAFNAASRSSLLLAQHPEDEELRVLVRGKGNLSERPNPLEFNLVSHSFVANGHDFSVPLVAGMRPSEIDVDELLDTDKQTTERSSKASDAREIIEVLLPRDGQWHPTSPIYTACEAEEISERTIRRAKDQLGIEHRRTATFPTTSTEWRWSDGAANSPASADAGRTSRTSRTEDARNPLPERSTASTDSTASKNASRTGGRNGEAIPHGAANDAKAAIEAELRRELEGELP
jgi:AAA domain